MIKNRNIAAIFIAAAFSLIAGIAIAADKLESVTVMALGPLDGRAVVKLKGGKMKVLGIGDTIPGTRAKLMQILPGHIVVEDIVKDSDAKEFKQTVWIYKPTKPGGKSRIQRLDKKGPVRQMAAVPVMNKPKVTKKKKRKRKKKSKKK